METKFNLCNQSYNENIIFDTFIRKCINNCQFDCELGLYKITQFQDYNPFSRYNYIPIKIIPRSNLIVQYEEQYVMDGWELIYQLGGVVGMWAGWSAMSIASISNNFFSIINHINYKKILSFKISKNNFPKIKIITIKIFILLNNYFCAFYRKFKIVIFTFIYQLDEYA